MADDDTTQPQPAAPAPGSMSGYLNDPTVQALLRQITNPSPPQLPAPPARVSSDGTRPGWLSLLGEGLGGGQSPLYHLSGSAEDSAGARSLLNFGIGMLMASGPQRVRPGLGQIFGSGLQAAQESMDASQKAAFTQAGQQFQQQKDLASLGIEQQKSKIEQLSAILPFLKLNALQNQPPLYGGNTPGQPLSTSAPLTFTGDPSKDLPAIRQRESGGDYGALNYVAKADPTAWDRGATATGAYQMIQSTWNEGKKLAGIDADKYPRAMDAPPAVQDQVAQAVYAKHGSAPWDASKYGANWVLGSDGRYQLVAGAQPGSRTGAPLQPGSTQVATAPAPAAPVAPASPSGVQLGGAPPAPPGGAPGAATGAPVGFGAALNPPAPVATAPGQPRADIAPTTPEGRLAALTGGMKLAQADMAPPGTVMAAGPAAGTPPTAVATRGGGPASYAPPPANLPAGNYNNTPAAPAQPPQQPVAPAVPPTAPPPRDTKAQGPDGSFTVPDDKLSVPEYQQRKRYVIPPDEMQQRGLVVPENPGQLQALYDGVQKAEAAAQAAHQQAQTTYSLGGDSARDQQAAIAADKNAQEARNTYNAYIGTLDKDNAANLAGYYKDQDAQLAADRKDLLDREATAAENEKNRQNQIVLERIKAGTTLTEHQQQADINIAQHDIEDRNTEATKAGRVIPILQQMGPQLANLPGGVVGGLLAKIDPTGDLTGMLARMGVVDPAKATAAQLLMAARNYLSIELKPAATGSLRNAEMDNLKSFTPGQLNTPQAQQEMLARLVAYQRRIQDEANFAGNYFGRDDPNHPGQRIYDNRGMQTAMNAPVKYDQNGNVTGGGLGPVVPEPPPLNSPDAEHSAYLNYVRKNVQPGMPYQTWEPKTDSNGNIQRDANGKAIPQRVTKVMGYD